MECNTHVLGSEFKFQLSCCDSVRKKSYVDRSSSGNKSYQCRKSYSEFQKVFVFYTLRMSQFTVKVYI